MISRPFKKKNTIANLFIFVLLMVLLSGCGNSLRLEKERELSEKYSVPQEKQLIVYTSHSQEVYLPIIREFENRTGIWVEIHAGGTAEMLAQVKEVSAQGGCDIMFGGGVESYEACKELFMPYETREAAFLYSSYCSEGNYWTPFTELPIVFVYNNKLVSREEAPESWNELLTNERFRGNVAFADPFQSGTSYTILATLRQITEEAPETLLPRFIRQLDGRTVESSDTVLPGVADGRFLLGITLEETSLKYMSRNSDISMIYPSEGVSAVPDGCAMVIGAPHSYNAGRFIDFVVELDTQRYAIEQFHRRTVRTDIDTSDLYDDIRLIDFDIESAGREEQEIMAMWRELMDSWGGDG